MNESTRAPIDSPILRCLREDRIVELPEPALLDQSPGAGDLDPGLRRADPRQERPLIGAVMVFHDVSQERRLQRALAYQATHDALTGLMNRREFESRLGEALQSARDTRTCATC